MRSVLLLELEGHLLRLMGTKHHYTCCQDGILPTEEKWTWGCRLWFPEFSSTDGEHRSLLNIPPSLPKVLMLLSEIGKVCK